LTAERSGERVVVVGSLNADLMVRTERLPRAGETVPGSELEVAPGGKSANQAVAASLLGAGVALVGAVGDDANGKLLLTRLAEAEVDVSHVHRLTGVATGAAVIVIDSHGENTIVVSPGANARFTPEFLVGLDELLDKAKVLCLCLEIPIETVMAAAKIGQHHQTVVALNLSPYRDVPAELLELTDVLLLNGTEASDLLEHDEEITTTSDWASAYQALGQRGIKRAIVTLGGDGAVVLNSRITRVPPIRVQAVDTTGSGDAFTGALAAKLAAGAALEEAAIFASRAGAWAATTRGTQTSYPTLQHLTNWQP
jgi:ribokinase